MADDDFYTTKEAAKMLGLKNPQTLAAWRCNKTNTNLKYVKIGGSIKYIKKHIDKFIEESTIGEN
jgi:hypothetical protein